MGRLLRHAADHPWLVLAFIFVISFAATSRLHTLEIHISPQALNIEGDAAQEFYERTVATFGSNYISIVFIHDPRLFDPAKLRAIAAVVKRLNELPFVSRTESLFSVPNLKVVDDFVHTDPFLKSIPESVAQAAEIRKEALRNPFVRRNLLSDDGMSMAINLYLDVHNKYPGFDTEVANAIERTIAPLNGTLAEVFQIGLPYIHTEMQDQILLDQQTVFPLAATVLALTLLVSLRRATGVILPLLTAGLSVLWLLGLMAALGIPVTVMTSAVPVLMVVVGSTEDIHLIAEYYAGTREGHRHRSAIRYMTERMGLTILLTFITSYLGFLSVGISPISLVREFGFVASTGLALNFLITATLVPASLRLLGDRTQKRPIHIPKSVSSRITHIYERFVFERKWSLTWMTLAIVAISIYGALQIRINNSILDYIDPESAVKHRISTMHKQLAGLQTFSIVIDGHIEGTFTKVRYLEAIKKLQRFLDAHPSFDYSLSFADYVSVLNSAVNESGQRELPEDDAIVSELMLFVNHKKVKEYISEDYSKVNIIVRHNIEASQELGQALQDIERFARENMPKGLDVRLTGDAILSSNAADFMVAAQAKSLALMLLVIFSVITLLFLNTKAGMLAIVPNLFPIIVLFGVMGYGGIPLDTGTAMIAAISIGICVDHTMHFMVRYNRSLREINDEKGAIIAALRAEFLPITAASIALAAGLASMMFSSFKPIVYFGALSAMVMLLAYYANFLITPVLLSHTRLVTLWDLLSLRVGREVLEDCELFQGMRPHQIKRIILLGSLSEYAAGEIIIRQGEPSREIFILLKGSAWSYTNSSGGLAESSRTHTAGHVFGVLAPICENNRFVTVTALDDCTLFSLDWVRMQRVARLHPYSASVLFKNIASIIGKRYQEQMMTGVHQDAHTGEN